MPSKWEPLICTGLVFLILLTDSLLARKIAAVRRSKLPWRRRKVRKGSLLAHLSEANSVAVVTGVAFAAAALVRDSLISPGLLGKMKCGHWIMLVSGCIVILVLYYFIRACSRLLDEALATGIKARTPDGARRFARIHVIQWTCMLGSWSSYLIAFYRYWRLP